jgi:hypothetical protein
MGREMQAMSEFVFLYRGSVMYKSSGEPQLSPAEMQEHLGKWRIWLKGLHDRGIVKDFGSPLEQPCKVIRGRKKAVTDGPYAEKDLVSGFTVVEAKDQEHAVEIATGCPIFLMDGSVEVRPIMKMSM